MMQDTTAEELVLAIRALTAAAGALTDAVLTLAKVPPPPSSKKPRGGK